MYSTPYGQVLTHVMKGFSNNNKDRGLKCNVICMTSTADFLAFLKIATTEDIRFAGEEQLSISGIRHILELAIARIEK